MNARSLRWKTADAGEQQQPPRPDAKVVAALSTIMLTANKAGHALSIQSVLLRAHKFMDRNLHARIGLVERKVSVVAAGLEDVTDVAGEALEMIAGTGPITMRFAEKLVLLSGPEMREAAIRLVGMLPDDSFESLIAKAYYRALADGEDYRARHLAKTVMVPEQVEAVKKRLAEEVHSKALTPEGGEE